LTEELCSSICGIFYEQWIYERMQLTRSNFMCFSLYRPTRTERVAAEQIAGAARKAEKLVSMKALGEQEAKDQEARAQKKAAKKGTICVNRHRRSG
jgi:hypothetical protein